MAGSLAAGAAGCFFLQWSQGRKTEYVGTLVAFLAIAVTVFGWYKTTGLQATEQEKLHELQVAAQREFILLKLLKPRSPSSCGGSVSSARSGGSISRTLNPPKGASHCPRFAGESDRRGPATAAEDSNSKSWSKR